MESSPAPVTGTLGVNLVGSTPSGAFYRLRDAVITVDGPNPTVFDTEDDPDRISLSADVEPGDYSATVAPGWRLERLEDGNATTVTATLISDNPALFTVVPLQRTIVPLRFLVDDGEVPLDQGYDIVLDVDEAIPSPGDGYQVIAAPTRRARLVFDTVREQLFGINTVDQQIEPFVLAEGQWSAATPTVIPELTDVAITPAHDRLIVLQRNSISDVVLADGGLVPVERAVNPDPFCGGFFAQAGAGVNDKVFIAFRLGGCSGFSQSYIYDVVNHGLTRVTFLFNGQVGASADGSRVYLGSNGIFPADTLDIYNPATNSFSGSSVALNLNAISVSGDASRVVLQNTLVYSRTLALLGNLRPNGIVHASRDSRRAFIYRDDESGPRLEVYDLNGTLEIGAFFPRLRTLRLPDLPNMARGTLDRISMTTTADDSFVFVSGDRKLLVVPVAGI
jgi:hypothetical protein